MKALEDKIDKEGLVFPGNVLKVGSFLNHQLDVDFLMEMGEEIGRLFENDGVTKIVTIEASGIAIAVATAAKMHVPVVFAKKTKTSNLNGESYTANVHSFTHNKDYDIVISKQFINKEDKVLLVDDFLAVGNALNGLIDIVGQAGAKLAGAAIAIEKGFQGGGDALRTKGIKVESLAIIDSMEDGKIIYRH
ncbi:MAG: xanthine phosphoribosyltransferase [Lachnospiraceae bacterium]|nr:xanthine phosphoribosyltransferase [Lachnospiraceae bacterium]